MQFIRELSRQEYVKCANEFQYAIFLRLFKVYADLTFEAYG